MVCSQCGNNIAEGSTWCPRCGAQQSAATPPPGPARPSSARPSPAPAGPGRPGPAGAGPVAAGTADPRDTARYPRSETPAFRFDARRWTRVDRIAGIATLALLISLFLPWFGVSIFGISGTADGVSAHGYLYLVLLVALAIMAYLVLRAGFEQLPFRLPLTHEQLLLAATAVNLVFVLLAFLTKPALTSWRFGAFVGLAAAIVAFAPVAIPAIQSRRNRA
jgi:hypothetical protein